jgi:ribosomal protein L29
MAVIKKTELESMSDAERQKKVGEIEKAILELRGEGRKDKVKPLRKAIAQLKTPRPGKEKKS